MFQPKDKVRHPGKPEWGVGEVLAAQPASHEGKPCQRLTIRFDGAGRKTISTAFADLQRLGDAAGPRDPAEPRPAASGRGRTPPGPTTAETPAPPDQAVAMTEEAAADKLTSLPEQATDPFTPPATRLRQTLQLYRYEPQQRSLLDWATAQTGLRDPLSIFSRHDLERHFETFRVKLDRHLREVLADCRRSGVDAAPMLDAAPSAARHALRRINQNR